MSNGGGNYAQQDLDGDTGAEFAYRLTVEDFEEAISAQAWRSPGRLICSWLALLAGWAGSALFFDLRFYGWIITLAAAAGVMYQRLVAERRAKARKAADAAEFRMVANDHGVVISSAERGSAAAEWTHFRSYLETPRLFVLVRGTRWTPTLIAFPKRGAQSAGDLERLRSLLHGRLKRV
ncbi:YcxB family protein [Streptomyces sp. NPDC006465]|uniref:YcxB family protein n=1 Tax=Streptomyces sp. NPDC006465 TaxID=3157174 RepID=UPI0033A9D700